MGDGEEGQAAPDVDRDHRGHGVVPLAEPVGSRRVHDPERDTGPVDHAVERVEHPPPAQRREGGGDDPGQEHRAADHPLEPELLVEQERQGDAQDDFEGHRDAREHEGVLEGLTEGIALPQPHEVLDADELAGPADEGVGEGEIHRHHEWIGDQEQQQEQGRCHKHRPEDRLSIEPPSHTPGESRAAPGYRDLAGSDGHASSLGGGLRPPSEASPRRSASRRTSRGWGPAVRGEQSENGAGEAGARSGTF